MPGTYKTANMTRCVQCPEGSISYGHGSALCEECRGNTVTNGQQTRCGIYIFLKLCCDFWLIFGVYVETSREIKLS